MPEQVEEFFRSLKNPDYLSMKYLLNIFNRMNRIVDKSSKKIFDNLGILKDYDISLESIPDTDNYMIAYNDTNEYKMMISSKTSEELVCHEFGHLLTQLFATEEVPEEFDVINEVCQKRLENRSEEVSKMLRGYSDEVFAKFQDEGQELVDFLDRNPEVVEEYLEMNPLNVAEDFEETALLSYFALLTNFDERLVGHNKISNIIDSMYFGDNPFHDDYGMDELYPLIDMHGSEYFTGDIEEQRKISFDEQFADYLVLRLYTNELGDAIGKLHSLIGDEWFEMMDRHYETIANRVSERGKVFQKKNDTE